MAQIPASVMAKLFQQPAIFANEVFVSGGRITFAEVHPDGVEPRACVILPPETAKQFAEIMAANFLAPAPAAEQAQEQAPAKPPRKK